MLIAQNLGNLREKMSDYPDLDTILQKEVKDWTNTDRNIILRYRKELGDAKVKQIRDELNDISENSSAAQ